MIQLVGTLIAVGILLWLANRYLAPGSIPSSSRSSTSWSCIAVIIYVLRAFGILPLASLPVPQIR